MELLQAATNIWGIVIQIGMLIIAIISVHFSTRFAYEKKQSDVNEKINSKADRAITDKIIEKLDDKADKCYVDDKVRSVHHRIDENSKHLNDTVNKLSNQVDEVQRDIKEILKNMR